MYGWHWRRRHRCGVVGRHPSPVKVSTTINAERFDPSPKGVDEPVYIDLAEIEALKLIDLEKLSFEEASVRMNVSRNTVWRLVEKAREKIVKALIDGRPIIIQK